MADGSQESWDAYQYGVGTPKDHLAACRWLTLASAQGVPAAGVSLRIVRRGLTSEQIAEVEQQAREFRPVGGTTSTEVGTFELELEPLRPK